MNRRVRMIVRRIQNNIVKEINIAKKWYFRNIQKSFRFFLRRIVLITPLKRPPVQFVAKKKTFHQIKAKKKGFSLHQGQDIFIISDLHLDHHNIIKYCHRPFKSKHHMNSILVRNWNSMIKKTDKVYFLGDLVGGKFADLNGPVWLNRLHGNIVFIRGNHDKWKKSALPHKIINYGGIKFFLVHDPTKAPKNWKGWVIHGHKHNNSKKFPFINGDLRTINASVEMIDYRPLKMSKIFSLNFLKIKRKETLKSHSQYK